MLSELRCRLTRSRGGRRDDGRMRWRPGPGRKRTRRPLGRRGVLPKLRALRGRQSLSLLLLCSIGRQSEPELLLLCRWLYAANLVVVIRGGGRGLTEMPVRHRTAVRETVSAHRRRRRRRRWGPSRRVSRRGSERRTRRSTVWNIGRRRRV